MVTTAPSIEMGLMLVQSALAAYFDERTGIETITGEVSCIRVFKNTDYLVRGLSRGYKVKVFL